MIIAIDGPAGSGKSTVAKLVAEHLGFHYLDTGAMYRAVAYRALQSGIALTDDTAITAIAQSEEVSFEHAGGHALPERVLIGGLDVTQQIRTPEVDRAVSAVASLPSVREAMVEQQRHIGASSDIVVEGRDIGTVVFPDAQVKVFLTASPEERARRRTAQQSEAGAIVSESAVLQSIIARDSADSTREHSPLSAAADSHQVDTTGLTVDQVVERIAALAGEHSR